MATALKMEALGESDDMNNSWAHDDPERYVYRDISYKVDAFGGIQFCFRNSTLAAPLGNKSIREIVDELPPLGGPAFVAGAGLVEAAEPPETPLDLRVKDDPIYIIYRIAGPANMTFHPERRALSHKEEGPRSRYGRLRHVTGQGHTYDAGKDCKIVYFACKPDTGDYRDGLNLRVRLQQEPRPDSPDVPRVLDLEIDPDIRFPGGSPT